MRIDYRWFLIFALSVLLIASNLHKSTLQLVTFRLPPTDVLSAWILGIITTLALFLSVFGHELSHALMAIAEGIEIEEIVLHPFGGLARLRTQPDSPRAEFRIAVAGPAASFLFSLIGFVGAKLGAMAGSNSVVAVCFFVGAGNLLLAVFNLFRLSARRRSCTAGDHLEAQRQHSRCHAHRRLLRPTDLAGADRFWSLHGLSSELSRILYGNVVRAGGPVSARRRNQRGQKRARTIDCK